MSEGRETAGRTEKGFEKLPSEAYRLSRVMINLRGQRDATSNAVGRSTGQSGVAYIPTFGLKKRRCLAWANGSGVSLQPSFGLIL